MCSSDSVANLSIFLWHQQLANSKCAGMVPRQLTLAQGCFIWLVLITWQQLVIGENRSSKVETVHDNQWHNRKYISWHPYDHPKVLLTTINMYYILKKSFIQLQYDIQQMKNFVRACLSYILCNCEVVRPCDQSAYGWRL